MHKLAKHNPTLVLDVLTARCVFEREAVRLYDAAIGKIERNPDARYHPMLDQLRRIRGEEKEHEEWLEEQIRALGGDPHASTTFSRLESQEAEGVKGVIIDGHEQLSHILHALVTAELADNAGWDLLLKLAIEAGDGEARRAFARRLAEEAKHLVYLREALHTAASIEILGSDREMPRSLPRALARKRSTLAIFATAIGATIAGALGAIRLGRAGAARARQA